MPPPQRCWGPAVGRRLLSGPGARGPGFAPLPRSAFPAGWGPGTPPGPGFLALTLGVQRERTQGERPRPAWAWRAALAQGQELQPGAGLTPRGRAETFGKSQTGHTPSEATTGKIPPSAPAASHRGWAVLVGTARGRQQLVKVRQAGRWEHPHGTPAAAAAVTDAAAPGAACPPPLHLPSRSGSGARRRRAGGRAVRGNGEASQKPDRGLSQAPAATGSALGSARWAGRPGGGRGPTGAQHQPRAEPWAWPVLAA